MIILLDDGTKFQIDEDETSFEVMEKFSRILKYMTFSEISIAKGLVNTLLNLEENEEMEEIISQNIIEMIKER